ncbi:MAG TPA: acyl-CoA dehydrogenase [Spirochaetota bacterium]|nr:acyl-CoA dehydrogenase [Spirochaetota bacterium]
MMGLNKLVDVRDQRFVLFEMLKIDEFSKMSHFADFDRDTYEATLELAEQIAVDQVYPMNSETDKTGVQYDPATKQVKVAEPYKPAIATYNESGFPGLAIESEAGGMGMPILLNIACSEFFNAASVAWHMFPILSGGALNLIKNYYTGADRQVILNNMIAGKWSGTMCLTEPDAGSDVGALKTKAVKHSDGTYRITGQKIFISAGDNDMYDNIMHPVLARLEGDPAGTKGISIFLVPKFFVKPDGSKGKQNDVVCTGIEHKMGIHGSPTCTLSFGDNGECVGYLMGKERDGMKIMFQMMNEARLQCSNQALAASSSAYLHAVSYARNRKQMQHVMNQDPAAPSVAIIEHPDVKRMLIWMKAQTEAMRMATYFASYNIDVAHNSEGDAAKEAQALVEFFIPLCKAGNSDMAWNVTSEAIQVYGGYGFCCDYPVEQLARDTKILSLYEGTNGIQSIDLTARKLLMNKDQAFYKVFRKRIAQTISESKGIVDEKYTAPIALGVEKMDRVVETLLKSLGSGQVMQVFLNASSLRHAMTMLAHAWLHLWSLTITMKKFRELVGDRKGDERNKLISDNLEAAYYSGRVLSSQYYIADCFPAFFGRIESILSGEADVLKFTDAIFTGAPGE